MPDVDSIASFLQELAAGDLLFDGRVEEEDIVDGQEEDNEAEAGDVAPEERNEGVAQGGQEAAEMQEREDLVEQSYLTTVAERIVTGSRGTFWWPRLPPVGTLAMASTTSMPATTLPKEQYFISSRRKLSTRLM